EAVGIAGVHQDGGNLLGIAESEAAPGLAAIGGLVHAVADGEVWPLQPLAAADVGGVGVGRRDGESADGAGGLIVEDGFPTAAIVIGLPHTAIVHADVEDVGLCRDAGRAHRPSAAIRSDVAPAQACVVGR